MPLRPLLISLEVVYNMDLLEPLHNEEISDFVQTERALSSHSPILWPTIHEILWEC